MGPRCPAQLTEHSFAGLAYWQWLGLFALAALVWIAAKVSRFVFSRLAKLTKTTVDDLLISQLGGPVRALVAVILGAACIRALALPPQAQAFVHMVARALGIAILVWALLVATRLLADYLEARAKKRKTTTQRAL